MGNIVEPIIHWALEDVSKWTPEQLQTESCSGARALEDYRGVEVQTTDI